MIAVGSLVAVTAVAVRVMAADANGCSSGVKLVVAAAPEIAPAVEEAAGEWSKTRPEVNGKCIQVEVRGIASADVASSLATRGGGHIDVAAKPAPTPSESDVPAVWIPDSTSWLARVSAVDRSAIGSPAPSVAMSPVVFAVPEAVAQALAPKLGNAGGEGLLRTALADAGKAIQNQQPPELMVGLVDPRRDSAGLGGAILIKEAVVTDESKVPNLIALYRMINRGRAPDQPSLLKSFAQGVKAAPMTEQSVSAYNATNPPAPLAALRLQNGAPSLDYPFTTLNGKPREIDAAAAKFRTAMVSGEYLAPFTKRGFRGPDGTAGPGFPVGHGVIAEPAAVAPLDDAARVGQTLGLWSAANSPSRAIALIDVSSSMAAGLGGTTRLRVLQLAAQAGLGLFTDTSSLGMWTYSSNHNELAPILPLTRANRDLLNQRIQSVTPSGSGESETFRALRDAYKVMTENHNPDVVNRIIVFTDGKSAPSADVKSLEQLNRSLESIAVVTKPIEVTLIGVGPDVDMAELNEIARITGGVATRIVDPAQIQSVFLNALLE